MPPQSAPNSTATKAPKNRPPASSSPRSWLQTPKPVRILFSHFPLRTLPANPLPERTLPASSRKKHTLYSYTSADCNDADARLVPSFNPTCLKWQTYMLMRHVDFDVRASSNHASPSGALPFVITATEHQDERHKMPREKPSEKPAPAGSEARTPLPITASKLQSWIHEQSSPPGPLSTSEKTRREAYISLIEHRIRPAWLHTLYLTRNLNTFIAPLYIHTTTTSTPVRLALLRNLRTAARAEIIKVYPIFATNSAAATETIYAGAESALEALSALLESEPELQSSGSGSGSDESESESESERGRGGGGGGEWFFNANEPGLLDASVFAYTFLLVDEKGMGAGQWAGGEQEGRLKRMVRGRQGLARHVERVSALVYG